MRAKSISFKELSSVGSQVAEFLSAKTGDRLGKGEVGYFPNHGIFGGERVLEFVRDMKAYELEELSVTISKEFLSPVLEAEPVVVIKGNILIFGGEMKPDFIGI